MKDDRETFLPAVGRITPLSDYGKSSVFREPPPKFRTAEEQAQDAAQVRERKRQAVREWLKEGSVYSQTPLGGSLESDSPINEVLVDGWVDFETLLNALDGIQ